MPIKPALCLRAQAPYRTPHPLPQWPAPCGPWAGASHFVNNQLELGGEARAAGDADGNSDGSADGDERAGGPWRWAAHNSFHKLDPETVGVWCARASYDAGCGLT